MINQLSGSIRRTPNEVLTPETIGNPLPNPPHGLEWRRNEDKTWSLIAVSDPKTILNRLESSGSHYHQVHAHDTLQGICLKYGCSALEVRRLNEISGDSIQSLKMLRIPRSFVHSDVPTITTASAAPSKEDLIKEFMEETGEGKTEAEFYLQSRNYRLELALADWKNDDEAAARLT